MMIMPCFESLQLGCAFCKIAGYRMCRQICCMSTPAPRPEFQPICLGLTGSGKTTLLCRLCGHSTTDIHPTSGFEIKSVQFESCIMNIKEIGGDEKIRQYWPHYYSQVHGIIYVLDSSVTSLDTDAQLLQDLMFHPQLYGLPVLVLANCQDKPGARNLCQMEEALGLDKLAANRQHAMVLCSVQDDVQELRDKINNSLGQFLVRNLTEAAAASSVDNRV